MATETVNKNNSGLEMTITRINTEKAYIDFLKEFPFLKGMIPQVFFPKKTVELSEEFLKLSGDNTKTKGPYKIDTDGNIGIQTQKLFFISNHSPPLSMDFRWQNIIDLLYFNDIQHPTSDISTIIIITTVKWFENADLKTHIGHTYSVVISNITESNRSLLTHMISQM